MSLFVIFVGPDLVASVGHVLTRGLDSRRLAHFEVVSIWPISLRKDQTGKGRREILEPRLLTVLSFSFEHFPK